LSGKDCAERYWYKFESLSPREKSVETCRLVDVVFKPGGSLFSRRELSGRYSFFLEVGTSVRAYVKAVTCGSLVGRAQLMEGRRVFIRLAHAMNDVECLSGMYFVWLVMKRLLIFF
jgi:hypothetical protein